MAQQTGISQSTQDKNHCDSILAQLTDMFCDSVPQEFIQSVGNANNWERKFNSKPQLNGFFFLSSFFIRTYVVI